MRHVAAEHPVESAQAACGQRRQRSIGLHQGQIDVGANFEVIGHLAQHLAMLAADADDRLDRFGPRNKARTTGAILMASGRVPKVKKTAAGAASRTAS